MAGLTPTPVGTAGRFSPEDDESVFTEQKFRAAEDLSEGISGRRTIDSTYDEPSESLVQKPRSGDMWPENDKDMPYRNWK